jgi:hypothetical protein
MQGRFARWRKKRAQRNLTVWLQKRKGFTPEEVLHYAMLLRLAEAKLLPLFHAEHMENEAEHLMNLRAYFEDLERYL